MKFTQASICQCLDINRHIFSKHVHGLTARIILILLRLRTHQYYNRFILTTIIIIFIMKLLFGIDRHLKRFSGTDHALYQTTLWDRPLFQKALLVSISKGSLGYRPVSQMQLFWDRPLFQMSFRMYHYFKRLFGIDHHCKQFFRPLFQTFLRRLRGGTPIYISIYKFKQVTRLCLFVCKVVVTLCVSYRPTCSIYLFWTAVTLCT